MNDTNLWQKIPQEIRTFIIIILLVLISILILLVLFDRANDLAVLEYAEGSTTFFITGSVAAFLIIFTVLAQVYKKLHVILTSIILTCLTSVLFKEIAMYYNFPKDQIFEPPPMYYPPDNDRLAPRLLEPTEYYTQIDTEYNIVYTDHLKCVVKVIDSTKPKILLVDTTKLDYLYFVELIRKKRFRTLFDTLNSLEKLYPKFHEMEKSR